MSCKPVRAEPALMRGMRQKRDRRQGGHAAERHWKELPRHTQSLSADAQSYRERLPPPMTLWCHTARELFSVSGDAQDSRHPMLDGAPPALPCPLHAHLSQLAQPGRTLLRRADRKADPPQQLPLYPTTRSRHRDYLDHHNKQPKPFLGSLHQTSRIVR
jgi:hypothetical protein